MKPFLLRWLITSLAVLLVTQLDWVGVRADGWMPLLAGSLLLGILNAFVRPVLLLLSLPLILVTMGLFLLVVNAITLALVGALIPGFHVDGFWAALFGALLISIVSGILSFLIGNTGEQPLVRRVVVSGGEEGRLSQGGQDIKPVRGRVVDDE